MMSLPKVSVIIPCYNVGDTIAETLDSVLVQTYPNIEIVTVNDGSTDQTSEILARFVAENSNVKMFSQENRGLPATRNAGFMQSSGEFLVFLDGDDKLHPQYIEVCYNEFCQNSTLDLVYTDTEFFEARTGVFELPPFSIKQLLTQNCMTATAMIRRESFQEVGMYDERLSFCEDWELWIRLTSRYPNVFKIDKSLFFYRKRYLKNSMTDLNNIDNKSDTAILYIYQKHYQLYRDYGYGIGELFGGQNELLRYKNKYYNIWYKKLFYTLKRFFLKSGKTEN